VIKPTPPKPKTVPKPPAKKAAAKNSSAKGGGGGGGKDGKEVQKQKEPGVAGEKLSAGDAKYVGIAIGVALMAVFVAKVVANFVFQ